MTTKLLPTSHQTWPFSLIPEIIRRIMFSWRLEGFHCKINEYIDVWIYIWKYWHISGHRREINAMHIFWDKKKTPKNNKTNNNKKKPTFLIKGIFWNYFCLCLTFLHQVFRSSVYSKIDMRSMASKDEHGILRNSVFYSPVTLLCIKTQPYYLQLSICSD